MTNPLSKDLVFTFINHKENNSVDTKAIGLTIKNMEMEKWYTKMEAYMLVVGKMVLKMIMEIWNGLMVIVTKEDGNETLWMV